MFQLICDPSGLVVETTLKELLPAVIKWGNRLDHILRVLLSHTLSSAQVQTRCISHFKIVIESGCLLYLFKSFSLAALSTPFWS